MMLILLQVLESTFGIGLGIDSRCWSHFLVRYPGDPQDSVGYHLIVMGCDIW